MRKILWVLLLGIVAIGCDKDNSTGPEDNGPLISLENGNKWVYDYKQWEIGQQVSDHADSLLVNGSVTWGTSNWFYTQCNGENPGDDDEWPSQWRNQYYRKADDGVRRLFHPLTDTTETLWFKYPAAAGTTYKTPMYMNDVIDSATVNVISTTATIQVTAGNFKNCYFYKFNYPCYGGDFWCDSIWVKPGFGMVKGIHYHHEEEGSQFWESSKWELKSYSFP